jgi:carbon storage regulator CsrA
MLVISRRLNEKLLFPGTNISIQVVAIKPGVVRLGIEAPPHVSILREELRARADERKSSRPRRRFGFSGDRLTNDLASHRLETVSLGLGLARLQLRTGATQGLAGTLDKIHGEIQLVRKELHGSNKPIPASSAIRAPLERPANERRVQDLDVDFALLAGTVG